MATSDPLMLEGQVLDKTYRIDKLVGEGGFGVVYRAFHLDFQVPVAVKCLKIPPLRPEVREAFLAKFRGEAKMLFVLSKKTVGIASSMAVGATTTPSGIWAPYFVLEWLDGESLEDLLHRRRSQGLRGRSLVNAVQWLDVPARALALAHREGVAHRDIKPANLFVLRDSDGIPGDAPTIKLLDFGIAKAMGEDPSKGLTAFGYSAFSPKYCAPEQLNPTLGATGPWSDVYSFALVIVEFLTDRCAVKSEDQVSMMMEVVNPNVRPTPRMHGMSVDQAVEDVFLRSLQVNPTLRYQNMGEFWRALLAAVLGDSAPCSSVLGRESGIPSGPLSTPFGWPNSVSAPQPRPPIPIAGTEIATLSAVQGLETAEPLALAAPDPVAVAARPDADPGKLKHPKPKGKGCARGCLPGCLLGVFAIIAGLLMLVGVTSVL